jgi:GT2 family glycosyltransferase
MNLKYSNFEVIVVDAGSTDGSQDFVVNNFKSVHLVREGRIGIGEAINHGIAVAKGDLIVFDLNSDDIVDKNWLGHLVEVLSSSKDIGIVCGKRYRYDRINVLDSAGGKVDFLTGETPVIGQNQRDSENYSVQTEVDYVPVVLTKREVIKKIGLCDEEYFIYFEDSDFCLRAKKAGYKVVYVPSSVFWHKGSTTIGKFSYRGYYYLRRNQINFIIKNFPLGFMFVSLSYCLIFKTIADSLIMIPLLNKLVYLLVPPLRGYASGMNDFEFWFAQKDAIMWNFKNIKSAFKARQSMGSLS